MVVKPSIDGGSDRSYTISPPSDVYGASPLSRPQKAKLFGVRHLRGIIKGY